jgi:GNAT superfamily N-acetyltransferase
MGKTAVDAGSLMIVERFRFSILSACLLCVLRVLCVNSILLSSRLRAEVDSCHRCARELGLSMGELTVSLIEKAEPDSIGAVEAIINQYNCSVMGSDYRPLTLLLQDGEGRVVGGLCGKTEWGWLYVATLAVREEYRNRGYGTRLLLAAEAEAVARGCHDAYLDTFSFQARPFYERLGYELFGVLEGFAGHTRYFLRKKLQASSEPAPAP